MLLQAGLPVQPINSAARAKDSVRYPNINSELWFDFAEKLQSGAIRINADLPDKNALYEELSTRSWKLNTKNQRQVQPKAEYKQSNNVGSPDLADSVLLSAYEPAKYTSWVVDVV